MDVEIPKVPPDLQDPIRSLIRAALVVRSVLIEAGDGEPVDELFEEYGGTLLNAELLIDAWAAALGCKATKTGRRGTE